VQPKILAAAAAPHFNGARTVVQMFKYVRRGKYIAQVDDAYVLKGNEKWSGVDRFLENPVHYQTTIADGIRAAREAERLRREREARRQGAIRERKPTRDRRKQMHFPKVVVRDGEGVSEADDLIYRGMSVNNIRNLQRDEGVVFSAQNPGGTASPEEHIVNDSPESPFLSFEAKSLAISAGKYAAKPVNPDSKKPLGVEKKEGGFLKQHKSYTADSRRRFPTAKRIGYVGGIKPEGKETADYSTETKASALTDERARNLAVADAEILVKPGEGGISKTDVPFVAKVQEVTPEYYEAHVAKQSARKALGYYKPTGGPPVYHKIQIPSKYTGEEYEFAIPEELRRASDDEDMSDIESMGFSDDEEGDL
jgi:hypothetical protein